MLILSICLVCGGLVLYVIGMRLAKSPKTLDFMDRPILLEEVHLAILRKIKGDDGMVSPKLIIAMIDSVIWQGFRFSYAQWRQLADITKERFPTMISLDQPHFHKQIHYDKLCLEESERVQCCALLGPPADSHESSSS